MLFPFNTVLFLLSYIDITRERLSIIQNGKLTGVVTHVFVNVPICVQKRTKLNKIKARLFYCRRAFSIFCRSDSAELFEQFAEILCHLFQEYLHQLLFQQQRLMYCNQQTSEKQLYHQRLNICLQLNLL